MTYFVSGVWGEGGQIFGADDVCKPRCSSE